MPGVYAGLESGIDRLFSRLSAVWTAQPEEPA